MSLLEKTTLNKIHQTNAKAESGENNMEANNITASKLAEICLTKCGLIRNIQPVLEALEEQLIGNGGAINEDEF